MPKTEWEPGYISSDNEVPVIYPSWKALGKFEYPSLSNLTSKEIVLPISADDFVSANSVN